MTSESKAESFLDQQGWNHRPSGDGSNHAVEYCPLSGCHWKFYMVVGGEKDGIWHCQRCQESGNLYQLKQRVGVNTEESISIKTAAGGFAPDPLPDFDFLHRTLMENENYAEVLDYAVAVRKFSIDTIKRMKLGACRFKSKKNGQMVPCLVIPYFDKSGKPIYYKARSVPPADKEFFSPAGREAGLFNSQCLSQDMEELIVAEGECLTGDTEVLTPLGWVRLDEYSGQEVAQWVEDGTAEYIQPLAYVKTDYSGEMYQFSSPSKVIDLQVTPRHRVLYRESQGGTLNVREAHQVPKGNAQFFRTARLNSSGVQYTAAEIRLYVALQADGTLENGAVDHFHPRAIGDDGWRVELKKQRKIDRLRWILEDCGIPWSEYKTKKSSVIFRFRAPTQRYSKCYDAALYKMSAEQRDVFCEEVLLWDGHSAKDGQCMYLSVVESNADLVQWAFAMSDIYAKKGAYKRAQPRSTLYWVCVQLKRTRGKHQYTSGPAIARHTLEYKGLVYCVQVPSGFIITRRSGAICVTGNCDALALLSQGYENVVGVPGANVKKTTWVEQIDTLAPKQIYLVYDLDKAGQENAHAMAVKIGIDKVKNILLPDFGGKDVNEFFSSGHTLEEFEALKAEAKPFDVHGVQSVEEVVQELIEELESPRGGQPEFDTPWPSLTKRVGGFERGDLVGFLADAKQMKTTTALNLLHYYAEKKGETGLMYCLEMPSKRMVRKWVSHVMQCDDTPGRSEMTSETVRQSLQVAKGMAGDLLFAYSRTTKPADVFDTIRQAVRRYGVGVVCFDNLQLLVRSLEHSAQETSRLTKDFKALAMELNILMLLIIQPHRIPDGQVVSARNAAGSSAIEKDVDTMICLHRNRVARLKADELVGPLETEDNFEPQMYVRVDLARYAPGGVCTLYADACRSTVRELGDNDLVSMPAPQPGGIQVEQAVEV
jgi:hypothetical protein